MARISWGRYQHLGRATDEASPRGADPNASLKQLDYSTRPGSRNRRIRALERRRWDSQRMTVADFNASLPRTKQRGEPRAGDPWPGGNQPPVRTRKHETRAAAPQGSQPIRADLTRSGPLEEPPTGRTP